MATRLVYKVMFTSLRFRLSMSYLLVLLIGMSLAAVLAWLAVEQLYLSTQRENLLAQANLTAAALQDIPLPINEPTESYSQIGNAMPGIHTHVLGEQDDDEPQLTDEPVDSYSQISNLAPGIHTRVLGEQGAVLVNLPLSSSDDPVQVPQAENTMAISSADLLQRSEIQQALQGWAATAIRRVAAADNRRVLYAAAPIPANDGNTTGIVYLAMPLPSAGLPPSIILRFAGAVFIAALLAGTAGMLLARSIALPLENLAQAANSVATGDLGKQVAIQSGIVELNSLSQDFNAMTSSLRQSDQAKNAFIADVTHELRTPLTVIKGTIETLEDGALDDLAGRGPLLASMHHETDRLIRLVNDLLVLTRADAGALQLHIKPLDIAELARTRCDHIAPLAAHRQIELRVSADGSEDLCVLGDADRLAQVLDNLLSNAIRHAPEKSAITVSLQRTQSDIRCTVSDHGPGIPAQHLPLIFERFYRVDTSRGRHTGGAGLGLAIVKALVLAQDGRISAQSTEGEGTSITFWLPASHNCHPIA